METPWPTLQSTVEADVLWPPGLQEYTLSTDVGEQLGLRNSLSARGLGPPEQRRKNGPRSRCFSAFRDTWPGIVCVLICALLLILTALYCADIGVATSIRFASSSSSRAIFILSVLSGLTGFFLAATISSTLERIEWILIVRPGGINFLEFLSLDSGTGIPGLFQLGFGFILPFASSARFGSILRLVSILLVPALGALIMSDVNTIMRFLPQTENEPVQGWGMQPFQEELAENVTIIRSQIVNGPFLTDSARSFDITPQHSRSTSCTNNPINPSDTRCQRDYLIPGGVMYAASKFAGESKPDDFLLAVDQQAFILKFREGEPSWIFADSDCKSFGLDMANFNLCLRNVTAHTVHARIVECPPELVSTSKCFTNTSWHTNPGWQTVMEAFFVNTTVSYSRANGSIISYDITSPSRPAEAPSAGMLSALQRAWGDASSVIQKIVESQINPDKPASLEVLELLPFYSYPIYLWGFLQSARTLGHDDPAFTTRGAQTLQSIMAMIMYFGQPSVYAQALKSAGMTATSGHGALSDFAAYIDSMAPPDATIYLASMRYQIVVGRSVLVAYMALCGAALLVCLCLIIYSMLTPAAAWVPPTTAFPTWNVAAHCDVVDSRAATESDADSLEEARKRSPMAERGMIDCAKIKVKLANEPY